MPSKVLLLLVTVASLGVATDTSARTRPHQARQAPSSQAPTGGSDAYRAPSAFGGGQGSINDSSCIFPTRCGGGSGGGGGAGTGNGSGNK